MSTRLPSTRCFLDAGSARRASKNRSTLCTVYYPEFELSPACRMLEFRLRDSDAGLQPGGNTCVGFHV